jgi:hypothetical protein
MEDLYCQVYVLTDLNHLQLSDFVASHLEVEVERKSISKLVNTKTCRIEVRDNEDFDPVECHNKNFLFYPIYLEIEPRENIKSSDYILEIGKLLNVLREEKFSVVAACDFEDQLPVAVSGT